MKRKIIRGIIIIFLIFIAGCGISIYTSYNWLKVGNFTYRSEKMQGDESVRLVVLADLHDHEFGSDNKRLAEKVSQQKPDAILLDGDFVNDISDNAEIPCALIGRLAEIAPVYFALGNHELDYMNQNNIKGSDLIGEFEAAGAHVLDKEYVDITVNGVDLRVGAMYDYAFGLNGNNDAEAAPEVVREFLLDFQATPDLKVMMCHRPDSFCFGNASMYWDVDLVIAAHNHGGQVVLPGIGGLYGGDQGWFPAYVHGMYELGDMDMFVTSGLSSNPKILPRFNNRPEIAVLEICAE